MGDVELQIFADRLKELRSELNLTQSQFVEDLDITASALSAYEKNLKNPSISVAKRIAEKYHVSIDWLCGLSEHQKPDNEFQTYGDIISTLFAIQSCIEIMIDEDASGCFLKIISEPLQNFLEEWRDATNVIKYSSINEETSKAMFELWKKSKIEEFSKIEIQEDSRDSDNE